MPSQGLPVKSMAALPAMPDLVNMGVADTTAMWPLGIKFADIFGNSYVYVLAGYGVTQGDAVSVAQTDTDNTPPTWEIEQPVTATLHLFAGVAMNTATTGQYLWIQVGGWNQVPLASTTIVVADWITLTNASSAFTAGAAISGNNPPLLPWYGFCTVATSSAVPAVGTVFFSSFLAQTLAL